MRLPLTPSWRWLLGGLLLCLWLFGAPFIPGYLQAVSWNAHMLLFFVGAAVLTFISRCEACGWPVSLRKLKGGGYLIGGAGKACSSCGERI